MKPQDIESLSEQVEYYEELIDYLCDMVPCLDELIDMFNREEED